MGHVRRKQPKRVRYLKLLCAFMVGMLATLALSVPTGAWFAFLEGGSKGGAGARAASLPPEPADVVDAPFIDQREKYPTGCESVSAVMALQYAGVDLSVEEFIDNYLPQGAAPHETPDGTWVGADPWKAFLGSPYEENGWGCYAPVIAGALEEALWAEGEEGLQVRLLEGETLPSLCEAYVKRGIPVILWATISMEEPEPSTEFYLEDTGELFTWIYPLHCLLLTGEFGNCYYFNDPLEGKNVPYYKEWVEAAYKGVGMQAVVLEPREG